LYVKIWGNRRNIVTTILNPGFSLQEIEGKISRMKDFLYFRQQLDRVLRTQDVGQVQAFLIAEQQWSEDAPADPELAMWLMILGSSTLKDLHHRASQWLVQHGHENEAQALGTRGKTHSAANHSTHTTSSKMKKTGLSREKNYTQQRVKRNWSR
jgi:hypothetical protein